ncbi:Transcription factor [Sesamum angolense]|uniref:Transcription factor n=1 Tax=Sesamum angolense TaxID=2727404 RepID=A0AAE1WZP2_9LAMI|nr:Transcription factor [Sesamum angolense]
MMEGTAGEGSSGRSSSKLERKTIEKNRRILMKTLCFKLVSLIPDHHFNPPKELLSQQDQLEQATSYIKLLAERVEEMKRRKTQAVMTSGANPTMSAKNSAGIMGGSKSPVLKIRELGSNLQVVLISDLCKTVMLHQVISILEQEGAEVVNVNLSNVAGQIFHTIHAQVKVSRVGVDSTRIRVRIQELIS